MTTALNYLHHHYDIITSNIVNSFSSVQTGLQYRKSGQWMQKDSLSILDGKVK